MVRIINRRSEALPGESVASCASRVRTISRPSLATPTNPPPLQAHFRSAMPTRMLWNALSSDILISTGFGHDFPEW